MKNIKLFTLLLVCFLSSFKNAKAQITFTLTQPQNGVEYANYASIYLGSYDDFAPTLNINYHPTSTTMTSNAITFTFYHLINYSPFSPSMSVNYTVNKADIDNLPINTYYQKTGDICSLCTLSIKRTALNQYSLYIYGQGVRIASF